MITPQGEQIMVTIYPITNVGSEGFHRYINLDFETEEDAYAFVTAVKKSPAVGKVVIDSWPINERTLKMREEFKERTLQRL